MMRYLCFFSFKIERFIGYTLREYSKKMIFKSFYSTLFSPILTAILTILISLDTY